MFDEASKPAIAGEAGRPRSLTPPKAQAQTLSDLIVRQQTERMDAMQACATAVPFRNRIRFILAPILQGHTLFSPIRSATPGRSIASPPPPIAAAQMSWPVGCIRLPLPPAR